MSQIVRVYIEGDSALRLAFNTFFNNALGNCQMRKNVRLEVNALGGRSDAVKRFNQALEKHEKDVVCILLVDSEGPLDEGLKVKDNLQRSLKGNSKLENPFSVSDLAHEDYLYLMVQCMEAWFLADREKLAAYFGQRLDAQLLPKGNNVEAMSVEEVVDGLKRATKGKEPKKEHTRMYGKVKDAVALLKVIRPAEVASKSPQCQRLIDKLTQLLCD